MALGGDDAQTTHRLHEFVVFRPLGAQCGDLRLLVIVTDGLVGFYGSNAFFDIAAQHDVRSTTGHVGGDGDGFGATRLCHDVRFTRMLFGIEHLVRQACLGEHLGQQLRQLDGGGTYQHRLTAFVTFADVVDGSFVFFVSSFVNPVELVRALARFVGRNQHGFQTVNFLELVGLGVGGSSHATQLLIQAEVVLKCDGRHGLVFGLDGHALLGLHRLVQTIAPTSA